jgi:hypothetical protein
LETGKSEDLDLSAALEAVLERLAPHKEYIAALRASGGGVTISVGWFLNNQNYGDTFPHGLLGKFAEFGADLWLDVYPPSSDEEDDFPQVDLGERVQPLAEEREKF